MVILNEPAQQLTQEVHNKNGSPEKATAELQSICGA